MDLQGQMDPLKPDALQASLDRDSQSSVRDDSSSQEQESRGVRAVTA